MLRIQGIELDGFKSYREHTVINDIHQQLTCVVGLNGSGKSNTFDAICFALGIEAKLLRGKSKK